MIYNFALENDLFKGYISKYNEVDGKNNKFAKGCFDKLDGVKIPVLENFKNDKMVGICTMSVDDVGLFANIEITKQEIKDSLSVKNNIFFDNRCIIIKTKENEDGYWDSEEVNVLSVSPIMR